MDSWEISQMLQSSQPTSPTAADHSATGDSSKTSDSVNESTNTHTQPENDEWRILDSSAQALKSLVGTVARKADQLKQNSGLNSDLEELRKTVANAKVSDLKDAATSGASKAWNMISSFVLEDDDDDEEEEISIIPNIPVPAFLSGFTSNLKSAVQSAVQPIASVVSTGSLSRQSSNTINNPIDRIEVILDPLNEGNLLRDDPFEHPDPQLRKKYQNFRSSFSISTQSAEIARLKVSDRHVTRLHADHVPSHLSEEEFWCRYLFWRLQLLQSADQIKRDLIKQAANRSTTNPGVVSSSTTANEELSWDETNSESGKASDEPTNESASLQTQPARASVAESDASYEIITQDSSREEGEKSNSSTKTSTNLKQGQEEEAWADWE